MSRTCRHISESVQLSKRPARTADSASAHDRTFEIAFLVPGVEAYAFTFG
jgi:hypothetical protein